MKPFDLEAAKRGEPIQTRDGTPVKFIAHVPEADQGQQVVILIGGEIVCFDGNGSHSGMFETELDLFMAHRKRTVWVNLYKPLPCDYVSQGTPAAAYNTEKEADCAVSSYVRIGNRAWPLEIEE